MLPWASSGHPQDASTGDLSPEAPRIWAPDGVDARGHKSLGIIRERVRASGAMGKAEIFCP